MVTATQQASALEDITEALLGQVDFLTRQRVVQHVESGGAIVKCC